MSISGVCMNYPQFRRTEFTGSAQWNSNYSLEICYKITYNWEALEDFWKSLVSSGIWKKQDFGMSEELNGVEKRQNRKFPSYRNFSEFAFSH